MANQHKGSSRVSFAVSMIKGSESKPKGCSIMPTMPFYVCLRDIGPANGTKLISAVCHSIELIRSTELAQLYARDCIHNRTTKCINCALATLFFRFVPSLEEILFAFRLFTAKIKRTNFAVQTTKRRRYSQRCSRRCSWRCFNVKEIKHIISNQCWWWTKCGDSYLEPIFASAILRRTVISLIVCGYLEELLRKKSLCPHGRCASFVMVSFFVCSSQHL